MDHSSGESTVEATVAHPFADPVCVRGEIHATKITDQSLVLHLAVTDSQPVCYFLKRWNSRDVCILLPRDFESAYLVLEPSVKHVVC
jgi:hypothetical protein